MQRPRQHGRIVFINDSLIEQRSMQDGPHTYASQRGCGRHDQVADRSAKGQRSNGKFATTPRHPTTGMGAKVGMASEPSHRSHCVIPRGSMSSTYYRIPKLIPSESLASYAAKWRRGQTERGQSDLAGHVRSGWSLGWVRWFPSGRHPAGQPRRAEGEEAELLQLWMTRTDRASRHSRPYGLRTIACLLGPQYVMQTNVHPLGQEKARHANGITPGPGSLYVVAVKTV